MPVRRLHSKRLDFPPADDADADGLLAIGGDLRPERLLRAYTEGIFPWFAEDGLIFWFSPDPRAVLFPEALRVSASLARTLRSGRFEVRFDTAFAQVVRACASTPRRHEDGTWIDDDFVAAYVRCHELGFAHSAEAWRDGSLVGGLYGLALGAAFFGESMFHRETDASKVAFATLVATLAPRGLQFVDCQAPVAHLARLGATDLPRREYLERLGRALAASAPDDPGSPFGFGPWRFPPIVPGRSRGASTPPPPPPPSTG
ncbi:MAG TPA: leucyl/phenylalanyl-tRNA--protein transferase [Planctomycetota bacterium]|nr:leucyl/phenylalanyl-tRNA--protein transferase [Planctomycetota bacterium]